MAKHIRHKFCVTPNITQGIVHGWDLAQVLCNTKHNPKNCSWLGGLNLKIVPKKCRFLK